VTRLTHIAAIVAISLGCVQGQETPQVPKDLPWSTRIAESFVQRHPGAVTYDSISPDKKWNYEQGLMLVALRQMALHSGEEKYFEFVKQNLDQYVEDDGTIRMYKLRDYNIDNIAPGRAVLWVYEATNQEKFRFAADTLRRQLREQPRTKEGGFWHKKIYPYQMWLDGLFMGAPFYALYAKTFNEQDAFDDIANQFIWIANHTRDPKTGLHYHAWDESREQRWANRQTGTSPHFWGRALGWYAMALVDVLDYFPADHPKRAEIIGILRQLADAVAKVQDSRTGLWYQVVDLPDREGNYLESSASLMFSYSFAKGVNNGHLDRRFLDIAQRAFNGIIKHKVTVDEQGFIDLHDVCRSAGLGGNPYRDGSFEYYMSEPTRLNDMKGYGPLLLAAIELEKADELPVRGGE
jgi:unsaturated rhamnogalacturonyl hydrolase